MRQDVTIVASGGAGNSVAANTTIASFVSPGAGRWKIWGTGRHSLVDGLKIVNLPQGTVILSGGAGDTINFGPIVFDLPNGSTTSINIQLNTATGASDTAFATAYLEKINH